MNIRREFRHFIRFRQITRIFVKNGLGYLVHRLGLESFAPLRNRFALRKCEREPDLCLADKLTLTLMELGPTFVKLGQLLSTRTDFLPPAFVDAFEKLQDRVSPFPIEQVKEQVASELGPVDDIFEFFDPDPLAAASIGQVHRARLKSGEKVIVKVQRPNLEKQMENDLEIIVDLARFIEKRSPDAARIGLLGMIEDYAKMLRMELDYDREAKNTERMGHHFAKNESVVIPRVYWKYTTRRILTEEYIEGIKLSDLAAIDAYGWDRSKLSYLGAQAFLSQVMVYGFFQADPHPGNILVLDENKIAFIDFGQTGVLTENRLNKLGEFLLGIEKKDLDRTMSAMYDLGILNEDVDLDDFEGEFGNIIEAVYSSKLEDINITRLFKEIQALSHRFHMRIPNYLSAVMKAFITLEGVGKKLDPKFNFAEAIRPVIEQVMEQRMKPSGIYRSMRRRYYRKVKTLLSFPANLNKLVEAAADGRLEITHKIEFEAGVERKLGQLTNRLSASLLVAGGLLSSSLLLMGHDHTLGTVSEVLIVISIISILSGLFAFMFSGRRSKVKTKKR